MIGGGGFGWAPGEMDRRHRHGRAHRAGPPRAGADLRDERGARRDRRRLDFDWARTAADVGVQTRSVLAEAERAGDTAAAPGAPPGRCTSAPASQPQRIPHAHCPRRAAHLHDADTAADAARALSALTHWDDDAGERVRALDPRDSVTPSSPAAWMLRVRLGRPSRRAARPLGPRCSTRLSSGEPRRLHTANGLGGRSLQGVVEHPPCDEIPTPTTTPIRATPGAALVDGLERAKYTSTTVQVLCMKLPFPPPTVRGVGPVVRSLTSVTGLAATRHRISGLTHYDFTRSPWWVSR